MTLGTGLPQVLMRKVPGVDEIELLDPATENIRSAEIMTMPLLALLALALLALGL